MQYTRFPIKFKHMIALINKTQTVLSFSRTTNFNAAICLDLIGESNVHYLSSPPEVLPKKKKRRNHPKLEFIAGSLDSSLLLVKI